MSSKSDSLLIYLILPAVILTLCGSLLFLVKIKNDIDTVKNSFDLELGDAKALREVIVEEVKLLPRKKNLPKRQSYYDSNDSYAKAPALSVNAQPPAIAPNTRVCNCQAKNNCPAGPPGPKGVKGLNGKHGDDGKSGIKGDPCLDVTQNHYQSPCQYCPSGQQGPPGVPGLQGPRGIRGQSGNQGIQGMNGMPGRNGDMGPSGSDGVNGADGKFGAPGMNFSKTVGVHGPKGSSGERGVVGQQGDRGTVGKPGSSGTRGPLGFRGLPGFIGKLGAPGEQGFAGTPGPDAMYCPCPTRAEAVEAATSPTSYVLSGGY